MPTKLNITPGPWVAEYESYVPPFKCSVLDGDPNNGATYVLHGFKNADISATVTAVNNTYHAGINPEAVEELLQVAKALWKQNILDYEAQENLNRIIQKATL